MKNHSNTLALHALDLQLLQTGAHFDLTSLEGRKVSNRVLRDLFLKLHTIIKPKAVFEIGAYEASFSKAVRRLLPEAGIYAFEASPYNYEHFSKSAAFAKLRIAYQHLAVTDHSGEVTFFVQKTRAGSPVAASTGSNSILERLGDVEQVPVTVQAVSISDFVSTHNLQGSLSAWIDVEGANRNILTGMADCLERFALIHCEVEERVQWKEQWLWSDVLGFLTLRGLVPIARDFEYSGQNNVIFVRQELLSVNHVRLAIAQHYSLLPTFARPHLDASAPPTGDSRQLKDS